MKKVLIPLPRATNFPHSKRRIALYQLIGGDESSSVIFKQGETQSGPVVTKISASTGAFVLFVHLELSRSETVSTSKTKSYEYE